MNTKEWLAELSEKLTAEKGSKRIAKLAETAHSLTDTGQQLYEASIADPAVSAEWTLKTLFKGQSNIAALQQQFDRVQSGDLSDAIALLYAQSITMGATSQHYLRVSCELLQTDPKASEAMMNLSLRCGESQRKSLLAIAELQNPKKTTFIKNQMNVAQLETPKLEASSNAPMDIRSAATTERTDSELATVAAIDGGNHSRGQSQKRSKRA